MLGSGTDSASVMFPHLVSVLCVSHFCTSQAAEVTPALKAHAPIINAEEAKQGCCHLRETVLANQFARDNTNL